ncbi:MAG: hypothetical protein F6J96_23010 [Symploca sp. SIO1C2]|nr:hypothetical protein [Symploca sp. SIO1C2]
MIKKYEALFLIVTGRVWGVPPNLKIDAPDAETHQTRRRGDTGTRGGGDAGTGEHGDAETGREGFSCVVVKFFHRGWVLPPASCLLPSAFFPH